MTTVQTPDRGANGHTHSDPGGRMGMLLASIGDGVVAIDGRGAIEFVNPAAEVLFGYGASDLLGRSFPALLTPPFDDEYAGHLRAFGAGEPLAIQGANRDVTARRSDGAAFPLELTMTEASLDQPMLVIVARDVTERRRTEDQLRKLAEYDPQTGLLNRRRFEQELDEHIEHSARYGGAGSVLVLDIDDFKRVNDSLGHRAGDELICALAGLLRGRLRKTDRLARLGGDEFGMLLHGAEAEKAEVVAEELRALIADNPFVVARQGVRATVSVGIAPVAGDPASGAELLARADDAKYLAKEAGRNRVARVAAEEPGPGLAQVWSDQVREAVDNGRLVMHAQPILDLAAGEVSQYELLVRMRGDEGELLAPAAFLDTAERFGVVQSLDRWVTQQAIRLIDSHARAGRTLVLEVNLSGKTMEDPEFAAEIGREITRAGIDPSNLIFEVTETAAVADIEQARRFAQNLTEIGCRFALDDFGSGFASFYYLKHLPIHVLKIDGEFVKDLPRMPNDQLIVKALVDVAQGMGMKTVAEFVEDQQTLEILRGLGVDYAQGYHIGRPGPVGDLAG